MDLAFPAVNLDLPWLRWSHDRICTDDICLTIYFEIRWGLLTNTIMQVRHHLLTIRMLLPASGIPVAKREGRY